MHYPLHITLLLGSLSILQDNANALKNGLSTDVLTSFAKNVAAVLTTTLLNDYQDPSTNQTLSSLLKNVPKPQASLDIDQDSPEGSEIPVSAYFGRHSRYPRQDVSPNEGKDPYRDVRLTDAAEYPDIRNPQAYAPYRFAVNPDSRLPYSQIHGETPESINNAANSLHDGYQSDIKAIGYPNHPSGFRYQAEPIPRLSNGDNRARFPARSDYHHLPPRVPNGLDRSPEAEEIDPDEGTDENPDIARITRRPFYLNYNGPLDVPYRPSFPRALPFYQRDRANEREEQPVAPGDGQNANDPSRIVDDQNQGQSTIGGYGYGPGFHYRPPYHGDFYPGFPGFYPGRLNESFDPGNIEQAGGNGTGYPFGNPAFYGHNFGPYGPYPQPFYPNFNGHGKPVESQNSAENQGNADQMGTAENGQGDVNGTGVRPPFGFPPYGPYYGGNFFPGHPLAPFYGSPYRFGYTGHDYFFPRAKAFPYLNIYPHSFHHFPLAPFYLYGGYHPYYNGNGNSMPTTSEKPAQPEKTVDENAEAPAANADVEMLSESMPEAIRSLSTNGYENQRAPVFIRTASDIVRRSRGSN